MTSEVSEAEAGVGTATATDMGTETTEMETPDLYHCQKVVEL